MNAVIEEKPVLVKLEVPEHMACIFCSAALDSPPIHVFEVATRKLAAACHHCATEVAHVAGGPFKAIPHETRPLLDFHLPQILWDKFELPAHKTFVFYSTATAKMMAVTPTTDGLIESTVCRDQWKAVIEANPVLEDMRPDVEAFLILETGETREYFIAPIDVCYSLVNIKGYEDAIMGTEAKNIQALPAPVPHPQELSYAC
ncbi:MAG TPA: DUF5947 family protein [Verrucomicrobiae bacterium]|nr:DUF5947 family protein [Verrucomicrobiae bacterium]